MDSLDVEVLYPESSATRTRALGSSTVERCFRELEKSELTLNQQLAIRSMLDPALKQVMVTSPQLCFVVGVWWYVVLRDIVFS